MQICLIEKWILSETSFDDAVDKIVCEQPCW